MVDEEAIDGVLLHTCSLCGDGKGAGDLVELKRAKRQILVCAQTKDYSGRQGFAR